MKTPAVLIFLVATAAVVWAQAPAPTSPPAVCEKNISFAVAEGGQPVPAIPKFTSKWIAKKSHEPGYRGLCFSQIPSSNMNNYVVVFSTSEFMFEGLTPSAQTYTSATPGAAGNATVLSSYGGTWSYSYAGGPPPNTTSTIDLRRDDKPKSLYARAYNQQGRVICRFSLGGSPSREKLLEGVLAAILGDAPPPQKHKPFIAPLSVYYVNCNVDAPPTETAMESPPSSPRTEPAHKDPPPPDPVLDFWSNPAGADIFLDGGYVGKTPYSVAVSLGEHMITLRKKDYGTWQRKVVAAAGKRRVGGYLEQKTLNLQ